VTTKAQPAPEAKSAAGLESVIAGNSALSFVDGEKGRLMYRGIDIVPLAEQATFEECIHLLWYDRLPTRRELDELRKGIGEHGNLPGEMLEALRIVASRQSPMDAVRTGASMMSAFDTEGDVSLDDPEAYHSANLRRSLKIMAQMGTLVAAVFRLGRGEEPVPYRPDLGYAGNFLNMVRGSEPDGGDERIFDAALTLHADHGFNASTFSARVTSATESDVYAAITSAIGTLAGRLHGGANARVMAMLEDIGELDNVEAYVDAVLARPKGRVMGFGHRVYKVEDPRATVLRAMARDLTSRTGHTKWFDMSRRIEDHVKAKKGLFPNVDFYSASVYGSLALPKELFTPIFGISRTSGWLAHVMEQQRDNRLIRPRANYVGAKDRPFVPLDER